jgi:peroxiredoxin-like protein
MAAYPMTFLARAEAPAGLVTNWKTVTGENRTLDCAIPKEFDGPGTGLSPEDLFLLALTNCYIATLKVIAENSKMLFSSIEAEASLTLDRDESMPAPWMKSSLLKFTAKGVQNEERFRRLMERVSRQCMIINSVKTSVEFKFEVQSLE